MTTQDVHVMHNVAKWLSKAIGKPVEIIPLSETDRLTLVLLTVREMLRAGHSALALTEVEHALAKQQ